MSIVLTVATSTTGSFTIKIYDSTGTLLNTITSTTYDMGSTPIVAFDCGVIDSGSAAGRTVTWDYLRFNDGSTTELTPASAFSGSAALAGSSSVSVTGAPFESAAIALAGSSSVSTTASNSFTGTAALAGSSAVVASGTPTTSATVALSGSSAVSAHATTPVDKWLARLNTASAFAAHRGGSADWDESTLFAYQQAAAWNKDLALEISMWKSADGYWVSSHDQTTGRAFSANYDIPTTNWIGTLQNLTSLQTGKPISLVTDILNAVATGDRVIFLDNKGQQDQTGYVALMASYGGPARFIVKSSGVSFNQKNLASTNGYQSWGYFYHSDYANLPTQAPGWTLLGMDVITADANDVSRIFSYGVPVLAHILATAAQKTTADAWATHPNGYMVSGVEEVVPQTPATVGLAGSSAVNAGTAPGFAASLALASSSAVAVSGKPGGSSTVALASSSTLSASVKPGASGTVTLSGASSVAAVVTGSGSAVALSSASSVTVAAAAAIKAAVALAGASVLSVGAKPATSSSVILAGASMLALMSIAGAGGSAALTGSSIVTAAGGVPNPTRAIVVTGTTGPPRWTGGTVSNRWRGST